MKNLLKAAVILIALFAFSETKAQISGGLGVHYGTNINNVGFSINGKYQFDEHWSAAPSFTFFLKKDDVSWSALDLDANYLITTFDKIGDLYGLAGLNMTFYKVKVNYWGDETETYKGTDFGFNFGLGLNIPVGDKLAVAPELRYTVGGANYLRVGAKVMYTITSKK